MSGIAHNDSMPSWLMTSYVRGNRSRTSAREPVTSHCRACNTQLQAVPSAGRTFTRVGIGLPSVRRENMSLQAVAFDRQLDAEAVGLEEISEARRDLAEQLVTSKMAADGAIDVEERLPFRVENPQQILGTPQLRYVARDGEQLLRFARFVANGTDHHIPPPRCVGLHGREEPDEVTELAPASRLDCGGGGGAIGPAPEIDPGRADEREKVADLERLHAADVHRQQPPIKIEDLDAIPAAVDQPRHERLAGAMCLKLLRGIL